MANEYENPDAPIDPDECECRMCRAREERQRQEDKASVRRTYAGRAKTLFDGRKALVDFLEAANTANQGLKPYASTELGLVPAVIRHVGHSCDAEIERLACECEQDHADLAEGIRLLLQATKSGMSAKYDVGITDEGQEERVVLTASPHELDAATWQRLYELQNVLVELTAGCGSGSSLGCDSDDIDIPF